MSQGQVIVTASRSAGNVYIHLAISKPPFYQLVVAKRGL